MNGIDVYKRWAPFGKKWVDWVRPVPFTLINEKFKVSEIYNFYIPNLNYINEVKSDIAIIVDLPGCDSIMEGIALAKIGYRPIPIYNGTNEQEGSMATTDNHSIVAGLIWGIKELEKINLDDNAPPVFLLDTNRMNRFKMNISVFDNSWDIYNQDIPSAEFFIKNGINKIIVRGKKMQTDLKKILYNFQKKGIRILISDGYEEAREIKIKKPFIIQKN